MYYAASDDLNVGSEEAVFYLFIASFPLTTLKP